MTPDEALEIGGLLSQAVSVYLKMCSKEYKKEFMDKIKVLENIQKRVK